MRLLDKGIRNVRPGCPEWDFELTYRAPVWRTWCIFITNVAEHAKDCLTHPGLDRGSGTPNHASGGCATQIHDIGHVGFQSKIFGNGSWYVLRYFTNLRPNQKPVKFCRLDSGISDSGG
ncbi:hypothetical protein N182_29920 [Sinorhizobium sp. GL2]|nr:hypothetical protein N182_29920 [Sinorhizobium sp. GL2]